MMPVWDNRGEPPGTVRNWPLNSCLQGSNQSAPWTTCSHKHIGNQSLIHTHTHTHTHTQVKAQYRNVYTTSGAVKRHHRQSENKAVYFVADVQDVHLIVEVLCIFRVIFSVFWEIEHICRSFVYLWRF